MNPAVHPDLEVMVVVVAGGIFSINFYYITTDPFIYGHISHNPSSSSLGGPFYLSVGWSSAVPPPTHQASQGCWVVVMGTTALIMVAMKLFFIISSSLSVSWRRERKGF